MSTARRTNRRYVKVHEVVVGKHKANKVTNNLLLVLCIETIINHINQQMHTTYKRL